MREELRWRAHLVRNATRIKLRIHALLDKENKGLACPDPFTLEGYEYLKTVSLKPWRRDLLDKHLTFLGDIQKQLDGENAWIKKQLKTSKQYPVRDFLTRDCENMANGMSRPTPKTEAARRVDEAASRIAERVKSSGH